MARNETARMLSLSKNAWLPAVSGRGCARGLQGLLLLLLGTLPGCAAWNSQRDALTRYERTRDEMDRVARGEWQRPSIEQELAKAKQKPVRPLEATDLEPENWTLALKRLFGRGPSPPLAEQLFREGQAEYAQALPHLNQKNVDQARPHLISAAKKFRKAADRWPKSTLEQNSLFYAGESYFFADEYPEANDSYELMLKHHPNSRHLDHVQQRRFAIGQYWLAAYNESRPAWYALNVTDESRPWNDLFGRAMKVFDRIRLDDPTGRLADDATLVMANAYFVEGKFFKADEYYTDLRRTFPSSEHQFTAHFNGLKAKLLCYEGPDYGATVLYDAEKLIEALRKQFPVEAEREKEYLDRAYAETRYKKAEREFNVAQYFDQKAEYGAAKQYFSVVLQDYGDTPFATKARARVSELGGLPDVPPQRFPWLVEWFPAEEAVRPMIATDRPKTKKR